jgi:hypothetical protein
MGIENFTPSVPCKIGVVASQEIVASVVGGVSCAGFCCTLVERKPKFEVQAASIAFHAFDQARIASSLIERSPTRVTVVTATIPNLQCFVSSQNCDGTWGATTPELLENQ